MSVNYTVSQASKIVAGSTLSEEVKDFGKRFPLATMLVTKALEGNQEALIMLLGSLPQTATMLKLERDLRGEEKEVETFAPCEELITDKEPTGETPLTVVDPVEVKKTSEVKKPTDKPNLDDMNSKQLKAYGMSIGLTARSLVGGRDAVVAMIMEKLSKGDTGAIKKLPIEKGVTPTKAPAETKKSTATTTVTTETSLLDDVENKSAKQVYDICVANGVEAEKRQPKQFYVDLLIKLEEEKKNEKETDTIDYSEMKPQELYKLCKAREITAETRQPQAYYIALLEDADAKESVEEDTETWTEEDDTVEADAIEEPDYGDIEKEASAWEI